MASRRALQTYGEPVLLKLVDGPTPQQELGAPAYALEALRDVGPVKRRIVMVGTVAEAHWYMVDEEGPRRRCGERRLFEGIPDDEDSCREQSPPPKSSETSAAAVSVTR